MNNGLTKPPSMLPSITHKHSQLFQAHTQTYTQHWLPKTWASTSHTHVRPAAAGLLEVFSSVWWVSGRRSQLPCWMCGCLYPSSSSSSFPLVNTIPPSIRPEAQARWGPIGPSQRPLGALCISSGPLPLQTFVFGHQWEPLIYYINSLNSQLRARF